MATYSISGNLFLDQNGDGLFEAGDVVQSGAAVELLNTAGQVVATTTTDANGNYVFQNVSNGIYAVQFAAQAGEIFSQSPTATGNDEASSVNAAGKAAGLVVNGSNLTGMNAGVYAPVSVSGTVFQDNNDNGLVDGSDAGQGGVGVQLLNASGQPIAGEATTTAANGTYSFTGLAPGTYAVQVDQVSTPGAIFSPLGSNTPPQPTGGTASTAGNLIVNGNFNDAGKTGAAAVTQGLSGWTVSTNTTATPYGSGPGAGVEIAVTNGSTQTSYEANGGTNPFEGAATEDNANPNYVGGSTTDAAFFVDDGAIETLSQTVHLTAGQVYEVGFDAFQTMPGTGNPGYFQLNAAINGTVITSASSTSGVGGGTALPGGVWEHFADLYTATTTGSYTLTFTYSSGTPGSTLASKDVLVDDVYITPGQVSPTLTTTSEVNAQGITAPVTLSSGQSVGNESAGIYLPPAAISGTVFTDNNGDGVLDGSETGLAGRTVNLAHNGTVLATTVTASNGTYSFANLGAGSYTVTVVAPSGNNFSPAGSAASATNSTVNSSGAQSVTLINGGNAVVNAGVYANSTLSGTVFNDTNADGVKQSGETGASGITVDLRNAAGSVIAHTTTNSAGAYSFTGVAPGSDTVAVVAPAGEQVSPNGDANGVAVAVVSNSTDTIAPIGLFAGASLGGTVFQDSNADGVQDNGESGVAGASVQLLNAQSVPIAGETTTTAANGSYSFAGLTPGSYGVQVAPPAGFSISPLGAAASPAIDNLANAAGVIAPVVLTSGEVSLTDNVGLAATGTLESFVFFDGQSDGVYHVGDAGVAGVTVHLLNSSGDVVGAATTNSEGQYSFSGVAAGTYHVQVLAPQGTAFSAQLEPSGNPLMDNDVNPQGLSGPIVIANTTTTQGANAGLVFTGNFQNTTPTALTSGQDYASFNGGQVVTGAGDNNVHTGSPGNNVVVLGGANNTIELGFTSGSAQDIGVSSGAMQAQTQQAQNGFLFAGGAAGSQLDGGAGTSYLMGGTGANQLAGGRGNSTLIAGGPNSLIDLGTASNNVLYQAGDGLLQISGPWTAADSLTISGYSTGQMITLSGPATGVGGIKELVLSATDKIEFIGNTPFDTGTTTGGNGVSFNANVLSAPVEDLSFVNGLPVFSTPSGNSAALTPQSAQPTPPAPTPAQSISVVENSGGQTLTLGSATTSVQLSGYGNNVTGTDTGVAISGDLGNSSFHLGNGNNALLLGGYSDQIVLGSGNNAVSGGDGSTSITLGGGNNTITLGGYANSITVGNGNNSITAGQGNETIVAGSGDNTITADGYNNSITVAGGSSNITAGLGHETVSLGSGSATVTLEGYNNLVVGGGGAVIVSGGAANTYEINSVGPDASMTITNFSMNNGDVLDLAHVMSQTTWNGDASTLSHYLCVSEQSNEAVIGVNMTGTGSAFTTVATLGNTGPTTLTDLQASHAISLL